MRRMETRNPALRGARLSGAVLAFASLFAAACSEPCASEKAVPMAQDSTPFKDGRSVFVGGHQEPRVFGEVHR